ncbi:hypothetical protein D3C76_1566610 [compost metagenome]
MSAPRLGCISMTLSWASLTKTRLKTPRVTPNASHSGASTKRAPGVSCLFKMASTIALYIWSSISSLLISTAFFGAFDGIDFSIFINAPSFLKHYLI